MYNTVSIMTSSPSTSLGVTCRPVTRACIGQDPWTGRLQVPGRHVSTSPWADCGPNVWPCSTSTSSSPWPAESWASVSSKVPGRSTRRLLDQTCASRTAGPVGTPSTGGGSRGNAGSGLRGRGLLGAVPGGGGGNGLERGRGGSRWGSYCELYG